MERSIYPEQLQLNKETEENTEATFLHLRLKIENRKIISCLYDKRDNFQFEIVSYPDLRGNITSNTGYAVSTQFCDKIDGRIKKLEDTIPQKAEKNVVDELGAKVKTIEDNMLSLATDISKVNKRIQNASSKADERAKRAKNIVFKGIPETSDEVDKDIISTILKNIGCRMVEVESI